MTMFYMGLVRLSDYQEWISPLHEAETLLYFALHKTEIEQTANAILAEYQTNGFHAEAIPCRRVGVKGDAQSYEFAISVNGLKPDGSEIAKIAAGICRTKRMSIRERWAAMRMPYSTVADEIASRLTSEVRNVNTILWEVKPNSRKSLRQRIYSAAAQFYHAVRYTAFPL
ncbi:MAG: hypothetical protein HYW26_05975 [Candidatus Aenigmarchaeota archaeon]|nr:hypothetical protein [Candidatus Aenigmarchaeota archaeon]